jgi:hypothetical protein
MSRNIQRATLLAILEGDDALLARVQDAGLVPADDEALLPEHAETARVVHTLVHELEVNWEGVEIILRIRRELVATRRQVGDLLGFLRDGLRERTE